MVEVLGSTVITTVVYAMAIVTTLALCVLIVAAAALLSGDEETPLARLGVEWRLSHTRMARLLKRRGIAPARYTDSLSVATLQRQVAICRQCQGKDRCDRALASRGGAHSHTHFTYCPNQPAIERYLLERAHIQV